MLAYVIDAARAATGEQPLVVYSPQTAQIVRRLRRTRPTSRCRTSRAARATRCARHLRHCRRDVAEIVVLSGDMPLVEPDTVRAPGRRCGGERRAAMALAAIAASTTQRGYGRVGDRGTARSSASSRRRTRTDEERAIDLVNTGLYAFDVAWLRDAIDQAARHRGDRRDLPDRAGRDRRTTDGARPSTPDDHELEWQLAGINDRVDLADAEAAIQADDRSSGSCRPA